MNKEQQGDVWSMEWEPVSQCETQRKVVLLTNAQLGVLWGHNDQCDHSWRGHNFIRTSNAHTACYVARCWSWSPFRRWRRASFPRCNSNRGAEPRREVRLVPSEPIVFPLPLLPSLSPKCMKSAESQAGRVGKESRLASVQTHFRQCAFEAVRSVRRGDVDFVDSKNETFLHTRA